LQNKRRWQKGVLAVNGFAWLRNSTSSSSQA